MESHTAVFILCLQSWLVLSTNSMPVPAFQEMKVTAADNPSEINGKLLQKKLSLPISFRADLKNNAAETENDSDDALIRHIPETGSDPGKKSSIYEDKRRLRLVKRRESGNEKNLSEQQSRRHSLHKRETESRDRRTWSTANALSALADMVVEHEQRRLAEERAALKRRLLELGKRSEDNAASRMDFANRRDQDFVSFLQAALSSSES